MNTHRKFHKKGKRKNFHGQKQFVSQEVKDLEKKTGHGFQEFKSAEEMNNFYRKDPEGELKELALEFEPQFFGRKRPSLRDKKISRGE